MRAGVYRCFGVANRLVYKLARAGMERLHSLPHGRCHSCGCVLAAVPAERRLVNCKRGVARSLSRPWRRSSGMDAVSTPSRMAWGDNAAVPDQKMTLLTNPPTSPRPKKEWNGVAAAWGAASIAAVALVRRHRILAAPFRCVGASTGRRSLRSTGRKGGGTLRGAAFYIFQAKKVMVSAAFRAEGPT